MSSQMQSEDYEKQKKAIPNKGNSKAMIVIVMIVIAFIGIAIGTVISKNSSSRKLSVLQAELEQVQQDLELYKTVYGELEVEETEMDGEQVVEEIEEEVADPNALVTISKDNLFPVLYEKDGIRIQAGIFEYAEGNEYVVFELDVQNYHKGKIDVAFKNIHIGDTELTMSFGETNTYGQNDHVSSNYYIEGKQLEEAGVTDFEKIECDFVITHEDGTELLNKPVTIISDAFFANYDEGFEYQLQNYYY